ncbi:hypothetical protein HC733_21065 [Pseudoalteromonas sp. S16_S37]|nr:hypothetical protein [Pseudoalteromonas sp. S16_S37]
MKVGVLFIRDQSAALVLKGVVNTSRGNVLFRQLLIVSQFAVAALLLVVSLVVNWQMHYVQNMPQGYDRDNVLVVSRGASVYNAFKVQAMQLSEVEAVTMSHTVPTKATRTSHVVRRPDAMDTEVWVGNNPVSYDFFATFGIKILSGRGFEKAYVNDAYKEDKQNIANSMGKLVINLTLAQTLGWSAEEAVGKNIVLGGTNEGFHTHQIIGVTEDTHYINAKNQLAPMLYVLSEQPQDLSLSWLSIRLASNANLETIKQLERIWLGLDSNVAFKYDWLSDLFAASYRNETLQTKLLNVFTVLAFVVTSIGLLGLAAFMTQRKVKEIAIRKVLGASSYQLCFMLLRPFTILILLANVVALPIAYWHIRDWLNNFIYRIELPVSAFAVGVTVSLVIAYVTILLIALKAIHAKPAAALASE